MSPWEGRLWNGTIPPAPSVRFLSYSVLSDNSCLSLGFSTTTNWAYRSPLLMEEILSYDPDILCLQDVDNFQNFWRPQLAHHGYESIYKPRTQLKEYHYNGILIAFRSKNFQMFKSVPVEFNDAVQDNDRGSAFREQCKTDDVGLIIFLQSFSEGYIQSALCVGCFLLTDNDKNSEVRMMHSKYFVNQIELANMEFHVPVLIGCNLHDSPASIAYNLIRTGRYPLSAQVPRKPTKPKCTPTCRGSVLLQWYAPKMTAADPPINYYRIAWRPGGSRSMGFNSQVQISIGDCVKYVEVVDERKKRKIIKLEELHYTVAGLCSDVPYEFTIVAENDIGEGLWSDVSEPVVMSNPENAPEMPGLVNFMGLEALKAVREGQRMAENDWNIYTANKSDPVNSFTQLTPRDIDGGKFHQVPRGRVLPYEVNARDGWKGNFGGQPDPEIIAELHKESVLTTSVLRDHSGFKDKALGFYHEPPGKSLLPYHENTVEEGHDENKGDAQLLPEPVPKLKLTPFDDANSVLLDAKEVMEHAGVPNKRQVHDLQLRSAYENYSTGGEPFFTASMPQEKNQKGVECLDFIFYTYSSLNLVRRLSMPPLTDLSVGERPQTATIAVDLLSTLPSPVSENVFDKKVTALLKDVGMGDSAAHVSKQKVHEAKRLLKAQLAKAKLAGNAYITVPGGVEGGAAPATGKPVSKQKSGVFWGGRSIAQPIVNHERYHRWLPNDMYCSSHVAIGAEFTINEDMVSSHWK